MLSSLLMFSAACASTSDRGGADPSSSGSSKSAPQSGPSKKTSGPTRAEKSSDPKAKPKVDPAKASPGGLTVRYLKDGKITQVDVPDFER